MRIRLGRKTGRKAPAPARSAGSGASAAAALGVLSEWAREDRASRSGSAMAAAVRAEALAGGEKSNAERFRRLVGADGVWWRACAEAAAQRPGWLVSARRWLEEGETRSAAPDTADDDLRYAAELLTENAGGLELSSHRRPEDATAVLDRTRAASAGSAHLRSAARAMAATALAVSERADLMPDDALAGLLGEAAEHWKGAHVWPQPTTDSALALPAPPPAAPDRLRRAWELLRGTGAEGRQVCAAAAQMSLPGSAVGRSERIDILVAVPAGTPEPSGQQRWQGMVGALTVTVLPQGPPGLYPDLTRMGFFLGDEHFSASLRSAWRYATGGEAARTAEQCVLWRIDLPEQAHLRVDGPSFGAALALVLTELLGPPGPWYRRLPRPLTSYLRLRPRTAVTGSVDAQGGIGRIGHLDVKLAAAGEVKVRVVAPQANRRAELAAADDVRWVSTVHEARRHVRELDRHRRNITAIVLALLLIGSGIYAGVQHSADEQALRTRRAAVADRLIDAARQNLTTNPDLATRLILEADAQHSTPAVQEALLGDLAANGQLAHVLRGHSNAVTASAITTVHGTTYGVTGDFNGDLRVWNLATGTSASVVSRGHRHVTGLLVNPLLPDHLISAGSEGEITFWTLTAAGHLVLSGGCCQGKLNASTVLGEAVSPDGTTLAVIQENGTLTLVRTATGEVISTTKPLAQLGDAPTAAAREAETLTAVTFGTNAHTVYLGTSSDTTFADEQGPGHVYRIAVPAHGSPTANALATGQHGGISALRLLKNTLNDNEQLLIGTAQGLQAYDITARKDVTDFPVAGVDSTVEDIGVGPQHVAVSTVSGSYVLDALNLTRKGGVRAGVRAIALDPRETYLLTATASGELYEWNQQSRPLAEGLEPTEVAWSLAYAPDRSLLVMAAGGSLRRYPDPRRLRDDGVSGSSTYQTIAYPQALRPQSLVVARHGGHTYAAIGDWSNGTHSVLIMDVDSGKTVATPALDRATRQCEGVRGIAFTPDGSRLVVGCWNDSTLSMWSTGTWQRLRSTKLADQHIQTLGVSPDGTTIVAGTAPTHPDSEGDPASVWFLSATTLAPKAPPAVTHPGGVTALAISDDRAYTGGFDGHLRAWKLNGKPVRNRTIAAKVFAVTATKDPDLLAASTTNGIGFYDAATLEQTGPSIPLTDPKAFLSALAVSPDTRLLTATAGADQDPPVTSMQQYRLGRDQWTDEACAISGGDLSDAEWARYGDPGLDRQPLCTGHDRASSPARPSPSPTDSGVTGTRKAALVPASGPTRTQHHADCRDFGAAAHHTCHTFDGGRYAWVSTRSGGRQTLTIYRSERTNWRAVLHTPSDTRPERVQIWAATTAPREKAVAILVHYQGNHDATALSVVEDGRVRYSITGSATVVRPERGALHLWNPGYISTDALCCPTGEVSTLIGRASDGSWMTRDQQAVPRTQAPPSSAPTL